MVTRRKCDQKTKEARFKGESNQKKNGKPNAPWPITKALFGIGKKMKGKKLRGKKLSGFLFFIGMFG